MKNPIIQIQKIKVNEKDCVFRFTICSDEPITRYEFLIDTYNAQWMADNLLRMINGKSESK